MGRAVICDCLPWLALLLVSCAGLWLIVRLNEGRLDLGRLLSLHRNEVGSAQSLSFVLTLPFFVVIVLFIVQVSQLMIGTMVVHYAAFAAARAAIVWIPAGIGSRTNWTIAENSVTGPGCYGPGDAPGQISPNYLSPDSGGLTYILGQGGLKYERIARAAYLACLPICPSRNLGMAMPPGQEAATIAQVLSTTYKTLAAGNAPAENRLKNKLAYVVRYTDVQVRFYHDNSEPPLLSLMGGAYGIAYDGGNTGPGTEEFWPSQELGWQDPITVSVTHYLALLPGPGRFLANKVGFVKTAADRVQQQIEQDSEEANAPENLYVYKLTASCTLGIEGQKSVLPYEQPVY